MRNRQNPNVTNTTNGGFNQIRIIDSETGGIKSSEGTWPTDLCSALWKFWTPLKRHVVHLLLTKDLGFWNGTPHMKALTHACSKFLPPPPRAGAKIIRMSSNSGSFCCQKARERKHNWTLCHWLSSSHHADSSFCICFSPHLLFCFVPLPHPQMAIT